jgi:hypothetical protein
VAGYFSEGTGSTGAGQSSSVYKWAFPTDTVSATTSALASMNRHGGFSNA